MRYEIAKTLNGHLVYVNLIQSEAAVNIALHPYLFGLCQELLTNLEISNNDLRLQYNMGRPVGYDYIVETKEQDAIIYARLINEEVFTRFIKNGKPTSTNYISMILDPDTDDSYFLKNTWVGKLHPPKPKSTNENEYSRTFWQNHAIVLDGQHVHTQSITKICPY